LNPEKTSGLTGPRETRIAPIVVANVFPTKSPFDGAELPSVEATPTENVAQLALAARAAQVGWASLSVARRVDTLAVLRKRILTRAEEIAALVRQEVGKPLEEAALAEVLPNADLVQTWCDTIEELLDVELLEPDPLSYPGKRGKVLREPRGVVALITPWNYPVAIPLRTLVPALLSGNAVVWKPSEVTPRCGALVASLFEGLLPKGVLTVVQGGADVGRALVAADIDAVVFTGSVATGRAIALACAERFIPCSLELGGKDAAIVLADCDLERTANGLVWGAFTNAGQNCAAIERVYVEAGVAEELITRVVEITNSLSGDDTGRMTTLAQRTKVAAHLEGALATGAQLLAGGAPEAGSLAFPPTVLRIEGDSANADVMTEETFGPLLPIQVVADVEEALRLTNASRYALTTSLWTKNVRRAESLAKQLRSGVVTINNHAFTAALAAAPWTGVGETGTGVTNGPHCLSSFVRPRLVLTDKNSQPRELWWYPYTPALRTVAFSMAVVRGGGTFRARCAALLKLIPALLKRLLAGG
jgi:acyl-CoA reductase-like NAD-dependent aldehyde dehydrogenase